MLIYLHVRILFIIFTNVKQIKNKIMKQTTREFIEIALEAMRKAYWYESNEMRDCDSETAKKVGDALQMVSDVSRLP